MSIKANVSDSGVAWGARRVVGREHFEARSSIGVPPIAPVDLDQRKIGVHSRDPEFLSSRSVTKLTTRGRSNSSLRL